MVGCLISHRLSGRGRISGLSIDNATHHPTALSDGDKLCYIGMHIFCSTQVYDWTGFTLAPAHYDWDEDKDRDLGSCQ